MKLYYDIHEIWYDTPNQTEKQATQTKLYFLGIRWTTYEKNRTMILAIVSKSKYDFHAKHNANWGPFNQKKIG